MLDGKTERKSGEGEAVCSVTQSRSTTTRMALTGWGSVKGGWLVFVCVGGGREGETDERRELSWNGAICHIGMALELHGGPPHSGRVFRSQSWEQGGAWSSREGSEVTAYSSPGRVSVSGADAPAESERQEAKKGVVGKSGSCQGSVFLSMLIKSAGEISV